MTILYLQSQIETNCTHFEVKYFFPFSLKKIETLLCVSSALI